MTDIPATPRCETCTYWNPVLYPTDAQRSEYEHQPETGSWGFCTLIGADGNDRHDDTPDPGRGFSSPRAFTRDGSDYWSALITRADFGCTEHAEKP